MVTTPLILHNARYAVISTALTAKGVTGWGLHQRPQVLLTGLLYLNDHNLGSN